MGTQTPRSIFQKRSGYFIFLILLISFIALITATTHAHSKNTREIFINNIAKAAITANANISLTRKQILKLRNIYLKTKQLDSEDNTWLINICKNYKIKNINFDNKKMWNRLLTRVDIIPVSLVIAQAAHESNWGKSRFSVEANNYFGQHCLETGCGIKPKIIDSKRKFEVRIFPDMFTSVESYMLNLNTNRHYQKLRMLRTQLKKQNIKINGYILAEGLEHYSQQKIYVERIRFIIKSYNLDSFDRYTH